MGWGATHDFEIEQAARGKLARLRSEAACNRTPSKPAVRPRLWAGRALRWLGEAALALAWRLEVRGLEEPASGA